MTEMIKAIRERREKHNALVLATYQDVYDNFSNEGYASDVADFYDHAPEDIDHLLRELEKEKALVVELVKERDEARAEKMALYRERIGEVWYWQGDGEDHVESLSCPILIEPEAMRAIHAEVEKNKTVSCDSCGFRYGAEHKTQATGGYDCPVCEVARLETLVQEMEKHIRQRANKGVCYCAMCEEARNSRLQKLRGPTL